MMQCVINCHRSGNPASGKFAMTVHLLILLSLCGSFS